MFSSISSWWFPPRPTDPVLPVPEKYDPTDPKQNPLNPKGLKPCCACPEAKAARDACFLQCGGDQGQCADLVKEHIKCMRSLGFNI